VIGARTGVFGDLQGIAGKALQTIEGMELLGITDGTCGESGESHVEWDRF